MAFSNLGPREKDAFFSLLDEYFTSRPEIFAAGAQRSRQGSHEHADPVQEATAQVASTMKRAMVNNPEATAKVFGAGLRHAASAPSSTPPSKRAFAPSAAASAQSTSANSNQEDEEPVQTSIANRIAAFSAGRSNQPSTPSSASTAARGFVNSMRGPSASPTPPSPAPAVKAASSSFSPPPVRRFGSAAAASTSEAAPPPAPPAPPPPPPMKPPAHEEEEEEKGDWAEAIYDYVATEPGDLSIKEGERILVTERSSDDWWTGEVNGKSGLFPASYAKLL